jgi:hypothetical protein
MQTFLPYKSFSKSAQVLDNRRLNKQILEGYQILKVLSSDDPFAAWRNHPAVLMWKNAEHTLLNYVLAMVKEADARGIKTDKNLHNILTLRAERSGSWRNRLPEWYSDTNKLNRLTESHRANLYRKDPEYYDRFRNDNANPCCEKCQYFWVTHEERNLVSR